MGLQTVMVQTLARRDHAESRTQQRRDHPPLCTPWAVSQARSTAVSASQRTFGTGVFVLAQIAATDCARGVGAAERETGGAPTARAGGAGMPTETGGAPTAGWVGLAGRPARAACRRSTSSRVIGIGTGGAGPGIGRPVDRATR